MKKIITFFVSILICLTVTLGAQEYKSITGKVQDATTRKALNFASIQLQSTNISNVTNSEGVFVLKFTASTKADTLLISYLGYKSQRIPVSAFETKELVVRMEPSISNLKPITIRPQDASTILKMALGRVDKNYITKPVQLTSFYREMIKKGNSYVSINEAVLDINKASYIGYRADQIGIYKARGNYDINRIDTLIVKFQGGPNSALDIDILKSPFLGVDIPMLDDVYDFKFATPVTIDDKYFYVVEFNQNTRQTEPFFRGKVYIESEQLAIARVEFSMNVEDNPSASAYFVKRKPPTLKMDVIYANYIVNYKQNNGLWFFDYSRTELKFHAKWDKKWFRSNYIISSEIAVTDLSETERKIEVENRIKPRDIISNRVNDFTDDNFWEGYNIIEPDQSIENVISRIIKQLRKRD
ncbi:MAG: carboxypeptidase-like regulatory domain-containing protein [Bacteroidales bacterium]|jgi:hypothetical protein